MKVRNIGRIMFPKGLELEKDIFPGEESVVSMGCEQNSRLLNALHSKMLEEVVGQKVQEPVQEYKGVVKMQQVGTSLVAAPEGVNPNVDLGTPASGPSFINDEFHPQLPKVEEPKVDEFAEFFRRKGASRLRYITEMNDIQAIRQVLLAARGAKSKAALAARIAELSHAPNPGELGL